MSTVSTFDVGITTLTNVDAMSNIALDVRDMAESLNQGEWVEARRIYEFGRNSRQYDIYGNEKDEFLSLQRMAHEGKEGMFNEDPTYMFQVLGLANIGMDIDETIASHGNYADAYITEQLNDYDSGTLGAQASTILIVSMYATHQLWDGLHDCLAVKNGFNAEADKTGKINPKQSFDNFIALYVGAGQTLSPDWDGDMLYELAQAGGDLFDTTDSEGEAFINSDIREFYQSIQRLMSEENYCTRDDTLENLWFLVNKIITRMYVPHVQMLIHSMKQEDQADKVRMYALAVIPQLSQCRPSIHRKLKDYLLDKKYDRSDFPRILDLLQQSYDCLGFGCDDVGAYKEGEVAECAGYDTDHPLASFIPKEDVQSLSKADLDIIAVDQLLKFPSTTKNKMAQFYYQYGRAAEIDDDVGFDLTSLQDMTQLSTKGKWSPYYSDYITYFTRDKFADTAIMAAFGDIYGEQRRAYLVSLMRYNVVPEFMMGLIGTALQICQDSENDESPTLYWDAFAALYIGSLEGIKPSSSDDDGLMLWSLAKNRARQFNTQNDNYGATVNDEMVDLLFAGQSEAERRDCTNFEKTASRVLHLMLVPLIQSTIWYAIRNAKSATEENLAIGEAMAYSVLPIVSKYDENAASVIERNMIRSDGVPPVAEGPQYVANAFFQILDNIGWGCDYIGQAEGIDACEQFDPNAVAGLKNTGSMLFKSGTVTIFIVTISATVAILIS
mmetsp:Transcript_18096/g.39114  ORF Transcript_18096/g.39114 Transcript_18096/m.39114 type:complete len:724 (-) Transcript_18096:113-2284(-)|eukprot:CAMPEP_0172313570 /NCGR_PEP_ID=MMETSP1058-20130122/20481_1 /TAXON_ID=83371 /ORGANISM="Detonula confervacea, Strain CCMP 353" /LENGTH=723 /DNA_ID=CAMNT_0013027243 /DNA_START=59 /DNA_END=2230 /DNA_ORIENTATION=-